MSFLPNGMKGDRSLITDGLGTVRTVLGFSLSGGGGEFGFALKPCFLANELFVFFLVGAVGFVVEIDNFLVVRVEIFFFSGGVRGLL